MDEANVPFGAPSVVPNPDCWLSRAAVAERLGVAPVTVWRMVEIGKLPIYYALGSKVGMYWYRDVERVGRAMQLMQGRRDQH